MFFPTPDPDVPYSACILPETEINFIYDETDLSEFVTEISISGSRGQVVSGTVVLKDRTGYLARFVSNFNQTHSDYRSHNMSDSRLIDVILTQGTNSVTYPDLIPGDPQWDNDATLTWSFTDFTPIIDLDNQTIGDYLFTEGDDVSSHDVIDDIEAAVDQTITPDFSPFEIGTFRANETNILSAIDELGQVRQAYRKWVGSVLHLEVLTETTPVWDVIDRFHIPRGGMSLSYDTSALKTYFKFFRDQPLASVLGEASCTGHLLEESQCVGRVVEIVFNRPTRHAHIVHKETNGTIEDGVFYDADNEPLPNVGGWYDFFGSLGFEAVKWTATYIPDFIVGTDAFVPSWSVKATGGPIASEESGDFEVTKIISAVEAIYGRRPEYKNLETELLRNPEAAQAMLDAIANEVMWSVKKINLSTPFLIPGREGQFVNMTHAKHGLDTEPCLINSWNHNFSLEDGWNNSYELRMSL